MRLEKVKPATSDKVRASEFVQLGSTNNPNNRTTARDLQVSLLSRRFARSTPAALLIAELAFGVGRER